MKIPSNKREIYLTQHWDSYPGIDHENLSKKVYGRIQKIQSETLFLEAQDNSSQSFSYSHIVFPEYMCPLNEILVPGDIVQLEFDLLKKDQLQQIILLTPNRLSSFNEAEVLDKIQNKNHLRLRYLWSEYLYCIRNYFRNHHFLEIHTPDLVLCPGTEPYLDVFSTEFKIGSQRRKKLYLPTSPELHLKKLLGNKGLDRIYEIKSCFRNGDFSPCHTPAFHLIEWYRSFSNLEDIQKDVVNLILTLVDHFQLPKSIVSPMAFYKMNELFSKHLGFHLSPSTTKQELEEKYFALHPEQGTLKSSFETEMWDDYFHRLFIDHIEPNIDKGTPHFISDYPPQLAAFSRVSKRTGWAQRFELYWKGLEICNAFDELNDPEIQLERFNQDLKKKEVLGKEIFFHDNDLIATLKKGMPPSAGIALGLERLFMALFDLNHIQDLDPFWDRILAKV